MTALDRGTFLRTAGSLVVAFSIADERALAQSPAPKAPGASEANPLGAQTPPPSVDSWLAVEPNGDVRLYYGKVELGTGIETAIAQLTADELHLPVERIRVVPADTSRSPNQGYTAGSQSLATGSLPVRQAAAAAFTALVGMAAQRLDVKPEACVARDGVFTAEGAPGKRVTYAELVGGKPLAGTLTGASSHDDTFPHVSTGKSVPRVDIPAKIAGTYAYVQNLRLPGMLHGRVIRPPTLGATLQSVDEKSLSGIPEKVTVVREGNVLGVVAASEWHAIRAAREVKATWSGGSGLPAEDALYDDIRKAGGTARVVKQSGDVDTARGKAVRATYRWPFQSHGSIGPSCAVADVRETDATIYSATQGVFPLRGAVAGLLKLGTDKVRVVYVEGSGAYGHNGADDAAADAAILSRAVKRPVRVQWMRADEHAWDPKGPAMVLDMAGTVEGGKVESWRYEAWSPTHSGRPDGAAGNLLAGQLTGAARGRLVYVGNDRNAATNYRFANQRVTMNDQPSAVLRQSALRGLGGTQNTFANESFMDELAHAAGVDPIEFRKRHIENEDMLAVLEAVAPAYAKGRGVALSQYENTQAIVAVVADVDVDRSSGAVRVKRVHVAHECGLIVNPDGLRNQIEGNVIQAASRALKEAVRFDRTRVTSVDWRTYPILRFPEIPEVSITLLERRKNKIYGAGEATTTVIAPAIANAIFAVTGARLRTVPFTPEAVKAALNRA